MSTQREVVDPTTGSEVAAETKSARVARKIQILERGFVNHRLTPNLPDDKHGEFVANDPSEISRMRLLGFEDGSDYVRDLATHKLADGRAAVGDVVFMVTSKENKEDLDAAHAEIVRRRHNPKSPSAIEEATFQANMAREVPEVTVIGDSKIEEVTGDQIKAALS